MVTGVKETAKPARVKVGGSGLADYQEVVLERIGYAPKGVEQAKQQYAVLGGKERFVAVVGGDKSGKSITAGAKYTLNVIEDMVGVKEGEELLYWLVGGDYERCRSEWNFIIENFRRMGLPVEASKRLDPGEIRMEVPGTPKVVVKTKSAKDPRTLAGEAPNGVIICEAALIDLDTYQRCLWRVAMKRGWLYMSGSYEGALGWYPGIIKAWEYGSAEAKSYRLDTTANLYLFPGGENDPEIQRIKRESSDQFFLERVKGIASPPKGLVCKEFRGDLHVREVEWERDLPIYIWEDPGYGHAHAIEVVQIHAGGQVQVIDEIYERGIITEDLIERCQSSAWWRSEPKKLVIDPHYAHQHQGSRSIAEVWRAKTGLVAQGTKVRIAEGTERFRSFLKVDTATGEPKMVFSPRCKGVLSELGFCPNPFDGMTKVYQWKMDREGNAIGDEPEDRYNDGVKAIVYGLVEQFGLMVGAGSKFFLMER